MNSKINVSIRYTVFFKSNLDNYLICSLDSQFNSISLTDDYFPDYQVYEHENFIDIFFNHQIIDSSYSAGYQVAEEMKRYFLSPALKETLISIGKITWESPMTITGSETKSLNILKYNLYLAFAHHGFIPLDERFISETAPELIQKIYSKKKCLCDVSIEEYLNPLYSREQLIGIAREIYEQNVAIYKCSNRVTLKENIKLGVVLSDSNVENINSFRIWLLRKYGIVTKNSDCQIMNSVSTYDICGFSVFQHSGLSGKQVRTIENAHVMHLENLHYLRTGFIVISLPTAIWYLSCLVKYHEYCTDSYLGDLFQSFDLDKKTEKTNKLHQILKQDQTLWLEDDLFENFISAEISTTDEIRII